MNRQSLEWIALSAAMLAGCGDATVLDASSDVHCAILAGYFKEVTEQAKAPADQQQAARMAVEWYGAKIGAISAGRWKDEDGFNREVERIVEAINADRKAAGYKLVECTERSIADPAFDSFARARWKYSAR